MPTLTLADLPKSAERKILEKVLAALKAEEQLSDVFRPIRLLENPTRAAFINYGAYTLAVQSFAVKLVDNPSKRATIEFGVMVSAYLPNEQTEQDSKLVGLDLGSYLRSILWGLAVLGDSGEEISFATTDFRALTPLIGANGNTRILSYLATFQTDIDPTTGDFTA